MVVEVVRFPGIPSAVGLVSAAGRSTPRVMPAVICESGK